jgi:WD40 repeat-containing protein SMU1
MLHSQGVLSLAFSKDDKLLASGDQGGVIRVWKFAEGKKLRELEIQGTGVTCILFTSNNSSLVAGCLDKTIRVYGLKSGSMLKQFKGHESFLQSI